MATYKNKNSSDTVWYGSEFKVNVSMNSIGSYNMEDVDFKCTFSTGNNKVVLQKSQMIEIDDNNYVAPLDSVALGRGTLSIVYETDIPDEDFSDGYRHEVVPISTNLKIK